MKITALHRRLVDEGVVTFSRAYLYKLVKEGKIPFELDGHKKIFDYDEVVNSLGKSRVRPETPHNAKELSELPPPKDGQSPDEYANDIKAKLGKEPTLTESKIFLTIYQGKIAQQKYQIESGKLIRREEVEQAAYRAVRVLRDQILALPERLSGDLASTNDPKEIKEIMYKGINEALEYLSEASVLYEQ